MDSCQPKCSLFLINGEINYLHKAFQAKELSEVAGPSMVFTTYQVLPFSR